MDREPVTKIQKLFLKQGDKKSFGLIYTQIHRVTVNSVEVVLWPRKGHPNKTHLHSLESCGFRDKILVDIL